VDREVFLDTVRRSIDVTRYTAPQRLVSILLHVIPGFRHRVNAIFALLGRYAAQITGS
jgi:hypothetical protein